MNIDGKTIKINVTQEDIDSGTTRDSKKCPVRNAIKNGCGSHTCIVMEKFILLTIKGEWYSAVPPINALQFIQDFDNDKSVEPFEFEMVVRSFPPSKLS